MLFNGNIVVQFSKIYRYLTIKPERSFLLSFRRPGLKIKIKRMVFKCNSNLTKIMFESRTKSNQNQDQSISRLQILNTATINNT